MMHCKEDEIAQQLQDEHTRRHAFTLLIADYQERLYWQIRKMVLVHEDADDVLQNTFLKAWRNIESFRGESKLSTWLYRIAVNECITFLNKQRRDKNLTSAEESSFLLESLLADDYFDGDELQLLLQQAILTLPEKQRQVFNMRYFDEMKYEQMSDILGTSVGALKASYHIATKKIEDFFNERD
ncbi:MAG: RNA polymerase sigma factor [Bacteroidales bacterium]